jgi:hypothetical protein
VPALLAEQKSRVLARRGRSSKRRRQDAREQLDADDGSTREPGGSPFASEGESACARERRAVSWGSLPDDAGPQHRVGVDEANVTGVSLWKLVRRVCCTSEQPGQVLVGGVLPGRVPE